MLHYETPELEVLRFCAIDILTRTYEGDDGDPPDGNDFEDGSVIIPTPPSGWGWGNPTPEP
ncbi:MAG: hypothetical protein FWF10_03385 [Clostridiales bacterium]|nr:hypothetical protein [Clostridiales bacterium]